MASDLEIHQLPSLRVLAPATGGVVDDPQKMEEFRSTWFALSGVGAPTVAVVNLDGRFLTIAALYELVVPLGQAVRAGTYGELSIVFASSDPGTRDTIKAIATQYELPLFVAPGADRLAEATAVGPLTRGEEETLSLMRRLGGRVTVAQVARVTGLDQSAVANRLNAVTNKHFAYRVERPKSAGHLYIAPWVALDEDAADPTSADFNVPRDVREDVRALAELQGRAPDDVIAEAVRVFLDQHRESVHREHNDVAQMMRENDVEGLKAYAKRFSKKKAQARVRRRRETP